MSKNEDGVLSLITDSYRNLRYLNLKRKGLQMVVTVEQIIDILYKRREAKPLIVKYQKLKNESGIFFVIHLPVGEKYKDFKDKQQYFADGTGGAVEIEKRGKAVHMTIQTEELKTKYPYKWDHSKYDNMKLPIPIGYSASGFIVKDLSKLKYVLIAGHPGSGKSVFLHQTIMSLLLARDNFVFIGFDGKRVEFGYLQEYGWIIEEPLEAFMMLSKLNDEVDKRLKLLQSLDIRDIEQYHKKYGIGNMPYIILLIDELSEFNDSDCVELMIRLTKLGRAAGVFGLFATQRPSSTLTGKFGDCKANFECNICFHVRDEVNSRMVLDNGNASLIQNTPGRAIYQWDKEIEIQTMNTNPDEVDFKSMLNENVNMYGGVGFDFQLPKRLPPR